MPITPTNAFKGRQYPGSVILLAVRWYLRYPLAYLHISEILSERGLFVDASCIWRWVQVYAPELHKRCRPHLKSTNKSYRVDETYNKGERQRPPTLATFSVTLASLVASVGPLTRLLDRRIPQCD